MGQGKRVYVCSGCGIELIDGEHDRFPMKAETYCRACHKKYPGWLEKSQPLYAKVDAYRDKLLLDARKEYFGEAKDDNRELHMNMEVLKRYESAKAAAGGQ